MREHGVSRTVVREALSKLQASGLVEPRHGIGTFVIERQAQGLDPAARERFCAVAERARILRGNAIEFSLPRAIQRHTGSLIERIQNLADA